MKKLILSFFLLFLSLITNAQIQLGQDIFGEASGDNSSRALALSANGKRLVIGSHFNNGKGNGAGHVRVFEYVSGVWVQVGLDIDGKVPLDYFGTSVSISEDGNIIAVSAVKKDFLDAGRVRIFKYINDEWVQQGGDIIGEAEGDTSGWSVSLSATGNRVAIGAPYNDGNGNGAGHVRVFEYIEEVWVKLGQDIDSFNGNYWIGKDISLSSDGNRIAINGYKGSSGSDVQVLEYNGSNWVLVGGFIDGDRSFGDSIELSGNGNRIVIGNYSTGITNINVLEFNGVQWNYMGESIKAEYFWKTSEAHVSISYDGSIVAIGDPPNGDAGNSAGSVRIFKFVESDGENGAHWTQLGVDIDGSSASDYSGDGVSLSADGSRVAIGAWNGGDSGHGQTRVYDLNFNSVQGSTLFDVGQNDCNDLAIAAKNFKVIAENEGERTITYSKNNGDFNLSLREGTYNIYTENTLFAGNPINQEVVFAGLNQVEGVDFCVSANELVNDVTIMLIPTWHARPGFETSYQLVYENIGSTVSNGSINMQFENSLQSYVSSSENLESQTANTLIFNYIDLQPFEKRNIGIILKTFEPPIVNGGEILPLTAMITSNDIDINLENNISETEQTVINSFDPNDKTVLQGNEITLEEVDEYLHYLVRFQNTGTASAINVRVRDVLENKLDWDTFLPVASSHPYITQITEENLVDFIFDNILLPAEQDDEPNSHGFVAFKIKPKSDAQIGDVVTGKANIYFDFNLPIITNIVSTEIVNNSLSVSESKPQHYFNIYPNPTNDKIYISSKKGVNVDGVSIYSITGKLLLNDRVSTKEIDLNQFPKGMYFLNILSDKGSVTKKVIKN
ncbi:T9SS type A sorting domain-containing protein [Flavivirga spongiicola]|uniref:T9SS type A sorting domain-containing protein n=1 Tax=Flavivirga spongiicola TaxID=421621 RepID=A0ABU7XM50_9FLAO|nr:T9SS type A sorting domain-containing protein [Flavivirga sp. MEBiC05379]MDO5981274.1 T9SS type A sorting domain-containing protein [Flavivirga sp. MEBiC05379]